MLSLIIIWISVVYLCSLFWQPSMMSDKERESSMIRDTRQRVPKNIHWLANLRIEIPEDLTIRVPDAGCIKIGYDDYGDILLKLSPRSGSGIHQIIATIPYYAVTSAEYATRCRELANDKVKIRTCLEDYLNR